MSHDVCVDAHLDPFVTSFLLGGSKAAEPLYLQTSPEFGMKRLLAAGTGSIFQITRSFRNGECGPLHNPEFTIVEWYRVFGKYHDLMSEVEEFGSRLLGLPQAERMTYRQAFEQYADCDPFGDSTESLAALARQHGFADKAADRDSILNVLLAALVEPRLGGQHPTFVYDYPATQAALARIRPGSPAVAERFELYVRGMEICNGFQELTDPAELRRRNEAQNEIRRRHSKEPLPVDSFLLEAMELGLPECTGVALGFDRLVMLALGAEAISQVVAFPGDMA